jgi:putative 4-mercaptohistidine N1-methyltranferase
MADIYETDSIVREYLFFHYGKAEDVLPWPEGPHTALNFPVRCAEWLRKSAHATGSALDLGCAVGRSAFALAPHFDRVQGIDYSQAFVNAASRLNAEGAIDIRYPVEGELDLALRIEMPPANNLQFIRGDACELPHDIGSFDALLMANLICRLYDPAKCLDRLPGLVNPGGVVLITTPCTWLELFTPREKWMGGVIRGGEPVCTLDGLKAALEGPFTLEKTVDMPFLIREHARKFQWSVAEASIWRRV